MDRLTFLMFAVVFLFSASLVEVVYLLWSESRFAEKRRIKRRLLAISAGGQGQETLSIYKKQALRETGALEKFLFSLPRIASLDRMLLRAGVPVNASVFLLVSAGLAAIGFWLGILLRQPLLAVFAGPLLATLPLLALRLAEKRALAKFDEQLPEAMDLLARALRSGHALAAGMAMVAEEMPDPLRSEFAEAVDEMKLGLSLREALENLCRRVPSRDGRMFALAVMIQKDTGGNIAEILDNISRLVRERLQFRRQVQALTAEGRLSAVILLLLPGLMFLYIWLINYDYLSLLWTTLLGRTMLAVAAILQVVGIVVIRRIVRIDL